MDGRKRILERATLAVAAFLMALVASKPCLAQDASPPPSAQHREENGEAIGRTGDAFAITFTYNSDLNADVSGGRETGAAYLQRVGVIGDVDLARVLGWNGAAAHMSIHSITGTGLSASRVGNLLTVSGLEAAPALRLFNLWVEQKFAGGASLRAGQFSAGQEFAISPTANLFVNSTFGWPGSFAADLPGGGPAYPVSVPGVRFTAQLGNGRTIMRAAAFTGDPPGRDRHGLAGWRFDQRPFVIAEMVRKAAGDDPAWTFVVGAWFSFARFPDVGSLTQRLRSGDRAVYLVADGRLWDHGARSVHGFVRFTASPSDRNVVDRYMDAGVTMTGALPSRSHDVIGLAVGLARVSAPPRAAITTTSFGQGSTPPEVAIEASYQVYLGARFYVQPNAQVIIDPYDAADASGTVQAPGIRSALILGLRTCLRL